MKTFRRFFLFAVVTAALIGGGVWLGKKFPRGAQAAQAAQGPQKPADSVADETWRKASPWLFHDGLSAYREGLIFPLARDNGLGPRSVRKRGEVVEIVLPQGRPIHEYAYETESLCARANIRVVEGREIGAAGDQVEYRLEASGKLLTLRLALGKGTLPGAVRMALVITGLGEAAEGDLREWLAFPEPLTLVFPDTQPLLGKKVAPPPGKSFFLELPMEPASFPYVKPGPRALFIHHSREEAGRLLRERLEHYPEAAGFATTHGDRAIENPALMESVLGFVAERSLLFLDLTGSPVSLTPSLSVKSGAESFVARVQLPGSDQNLEAELERRLGLAKKAGEGIWVLRQAPGLPAVLARLLRKRSDQFEELGMKWVILGDLRRESGD